MKLIVPLLSFFISLNALSQTDSDIKSILDLSKDAIRLNGKLIYTIQLDSFHLSLIKRRLEYAPIYEYKMKKDAVGELVPDLGSSNYIDSLVLSENEIKYVSTSLYSKDTSNWIKNYFANSHFISKEIIDTIFADEQKGWDYFHSEYGSCFFTLPKPVFIRSNTVCFFYTSDSCDWLGGSGALIIFTKINGSWKYYSEICNWIS